MFGSRGINEVKEFVGGGGSNIRFWRGGGGGRFLSFLTRISRCKICFNLILLTKFILLTRQLCFFSSSFFSLHSYLSTLHQHNGVIKMCDSVSDGYPFRAVVRSNP